MAGGGLPRGKRIMMKQVYRFAQIAFPCLVLLFYCVPDIDLSISRALWSIDQTFWGTKVTWMTLVHENLGKLLAVVVVAMFIGWGLTWLSVVPYTLKRHRKSLGFMLLAVIIGPGLVVNLLFKDQWGRARPVQIVEFGGERQFTPAWAMSHECKKNCSFVCGDTSLGFVLIAGAFISRRPRFWFITSLLVGGLLGFMRIAQGGHFLSDVIFSWYAVLFSVWLVARWLRPGQWHQVFKPSRIPVDDTTDTPLAPSNSKSSHNYYKDCSS